MNDLPAHSIQAFRQHVIKAENGFYETTRINLTRNYFMNKKTKILIAGIGGVGGYFGGLLAKQFYKSSEVEIYFLARGEHLRQIKTYGLKVIKGDNQFIAFPKLATDNATEIGIADYIILCTKSYDLEKTIEQLKPCIDGHTSLLPLLNGVDNAETIKNALPTSTVFNGCVYIVALIKEAGKVANVGNIQKLFFGIDNTNSNQLSLLETIFKRATIDATLTRNISSVVWEKFYLVAANSTATSYFNNSTGEILTDPIKNKFLISLLDEVNLIARAKGISFEKDMVADTIGKLNSFPYDATSSMQRDFQRPNARTELETITGFIIREGQKLNIETPSFKIAYDALLNYNRTNA